MLDFSTPILTAAEWSSENKPYSVRTLDPCPEGVKKVSTVEVVKKGSQHSKIQQEVNSRNLIITFFLFFSVMLEARLNKSGLFK